jgi:hypothetical protein
MPKRSRVGSKGAPSSDHNTRGCVLNGLFWLVPGILGAAGVLACTQSWQQKMEEGSGRDVCAPRMGEGEQTGRLRSQGRRDRRRPRLHSVMAVGDGRGEQTRRLRSRGGRRGSGRGVCAPEEGADGTSALPGALGPQASSPAFSGCGRWREGSRRGVCAPGVGEGERTRRLRSRGGRRGDERSGRRRLRSRGGRRGADETSALPGEADETFALPGEADETSALPGGADGTSTLPGWEEGERTGRLRSQEKADGDVYAPGVGEGDRRGRLRSQEERTRCLRSRGAERLCLGNGLSARSSGFTPTTDEVAPPVASPAAKSAPPARRRPADGRRKG